MTVIFGTNFALHVYDPTLVLGKEDGFTLLKEDGFEILIDQQEFSDYAATHARIAHSRNWHSGGTVTASSTAADYYAAAPANTLTYEKWKPSALPATWQYQHTSEALCDYCCIGGHRMGTNGNTLEVQYYNGAAWVDLFPAQAITDDSDIFVLFNPRSYLYWRIRITDGTAPEISVIKFGLALQMPRPIFGGHTPMIMARQTVMKMNESESGEYLGRSKWRTYMETTYAWQNLPASWIRTNWPDFQRAIETEPFFIAWRPETYSEAAFGRAMSVPTPSNSGTRDLMAVDLQMRALSHD